MSGSGVPHRDINTPETEAGRVTTKTFDSVERSRKDQSLKRQLKRNDCYVRQLGYVEN